MKKNYINKSLAVFWGVIIFIGFQSAVVADPPEILVPRGSHWKYEDSGTDLGTAWREAGYDDIKWRQGKALFGSDNPEIQTQLSAGSYTYYFRTEFNLSVDPASIGKLALLANYNDGFVAYINGQEVTRQSMPSGNIFYTTIANKHGSNVFEAVNLTGSKEVLIKGSNLLTIEVHHWDGYNNDLLLDMELLYFAAGSGNLFGQNIIVTRGPYLQMGGTSDITVRWSTQDTTDSRVRYGTDPNNLTQIVDSSAWVFKHEIRLTGLQPGTFYYYAVGTTSDDLVTGPDFNFKTAPPTGPAAKTRVWILGDSGTGNNDAKRVRNAYYAFTDTVHTDLWIMLGDNAYNSGKENEYQSKLFNIYPTMLTQSVLWPAFGNHDGMSSNSNNETGPFYEIFSLPKNGEAGGTPSGTEAFYSWDYANIHFICLNSHDVSRSVTGPMLTWLQSDLANSNLDWTIALWHHPPYTKGSHNSDNETRLKDMRRNALPILEQAGVDLVLGGHSHSYERSFMLDEHYGFSSTLVDSMIIDTGDGRLDGDGAYIKSTLGSAAHEGTVYVVAGSSGKTSNGSLNHPAMYVSLKKLGSVVLDINQNQMDLVFIDDIGTRLDYFTMIKDSFVVGLITQLNSFYGNAGDGFVELTWETRFEADNSGFEILRARDLSGPYRLIDSYKTNEELKGQGNSTIAAQYHYTDYDLVNGAVYWYKLRRVDFRGGQTEHGPVRLQPVSENLATLDPETVPDILRLQHNFPNPFNPNTNIVFDIPDNSKGYSEVQLDIYDVRGQNVKRLLKGKFASGRYKVKWDATNHRGERVPTGVYIYSLRAGKKLLARQMTLIR